MACELARPEYSCEPLENYYLHDIQEMLRHIQQREWDARSAMMISTRRSSPAFSITPVPMTFRSEESSEMVESPTAMEPPCSAFRSPAQLFAGRSRPLNPSITYGPSLSATFRASLTSTIGPGPERHTPRGNRPTQEGCFRRQKPTSQAHPYTRLKNIIQRLRIWYRRTSHFQNRQDVQDLHHLVEHRLYTVNKHPLAMVHATSAAGNPAQTNTKTGKVVWNVILQNNIMTPGSNANIALSVTKEAPLY